MYISNEIRVKDEVSAVSILYNQKPKKKKKEKKGGRFEKYKP